MNIGKKIKNLRTEKLMTQSELAGSEITRNMLSRIENGAALPSLGTVFYLAKRLGVPAGYLLSEGDEEFIYNKTSVMKNIRRAYTDKNFELCRDMCLSSFEDFDDELELILTDSCLGVAEEYMLSGQLHRACAFLDEAITHSQKTMFDTTSQRNCVTVMFGLLKEISPALDSDEADTSLGGELLHPSVFGSVFCKYISVILNIEKYNTYLADIERYDKENFTDVDKLLSLHLKARKEINEGNFRDARAILKNVIDSDTIPPRLLLYLACSDMEICCKETDDYKGAYEFSQNKMEILEHMLIED